MQKRMLDVQALEAVRCLDEGVVREPKDADVGSIMGWAFAPYTGGVVSYIDYVGVAEFVEECDDFHRKYGAPFAHYGPHYAQRFVVPDSLRKMAAEGRKFYND
jgi:3-hydroxyacyl-CoA dehydrogenase/enoyl-CoA hydratase/3-hydroxybutyryl-CoA epimerase